MKRIIIYIALAMLLTACSGSQEFEPSTYKPSTVATDDHVRPVIERANYTPRNVEKKQKRARRPPSKQGVSVDTLATPVERHRLKVGYGVFGMNESLADHTPRFSKYQFPELLKSRNVQGVPYEQYFSLAGGRIRFVPNEEDVVSDYLVYKDEEPIIRYEFVLRGGSFLEFIGETIHVLGNTYTIKDVTAKDITLQNQNTTLIIGGGEVIMNGEKLGATSSRMYGNRFIVESMADADSDSAMYVPRNSSVQEVLDSPTLLTNKLDIEYKGVVTTPAVNVHVRQRDKTVELIVNEHGKKLTFPVVYQNSGLRWGDEDGKLVVDESESINVGEYLILTSDRSRVVQYGGRNDEALEFDALGLGIDVHLNRSSIPFHGATYNYKLKNDSIRVDMNGDGDFTDTVRYRRPSFSITFESNHSITFNFAGDVSRSITFEQGSEGPVLLPEFSGYDIDDGFVSSTNYGTRYVFQGELGNGFEDARITYPVRRGVAEIVVESLANRPAYVSDLH